MTGFMTQVPGNTALIGPPQPSYSQLTPGAGLAGIGGVMDIFGGFQQKSAYDMESGALKKQAQQALQDAGMNAQAKATEVQQIAGQQMEEYSSSGVTQEGTPAQVVASTRARGQQEVNAIVNRGELQAQMMRTQANQLKSAGRNAILGGLFKAGMSVAPFI